VLAKAAVIMTVTNLAWTKGIMQYRLLLFPLIV